MQLEVGQAQAPDSSGFRHAQPAPTLRRRDVNLDLHELTQNQWIEFNDSISQIDYLSISIFRVAEKSAACKL